MCVNNANSIKTKRVTLRSSEAVTYISATENIFIEEMSALIIYKSAPELFPIEGISALVYTPKWQPQDIHPMFYKCFTPNNEGVKQKPSSTIGGVNNFRGHKKPSSRASGDDSKRIYLHKNEATRETWLERGSQGDFGDPFLPKTRNAYKNKVLSRSCILRSERAL